jgi:outer membrane porin, OprD family
MNRKIKAGIIHALIGGLVLPMAASAVEGEHQLELKARGVYWEDESLAYPTSTTRNPKPSAYEQSALGVQINYRSPFWANMIGVDASIFGVVKIADSGVPTTNLLEVGNDGKLDSAYTTVGLAALKFKYDDVAFARVGRQLQDSLLLKSTYTRTVPDTYSGLTASVAPIIGVSVYGALFNEWRPRSSPDFEKFRTESTATGVPNEISYVSIFGATYKSGPVSVTAEYLNSKDYLSKFGLVGGYTIPFETSSLKLSGGVLASRDAGNLFVCGAEREMDCTGTKRINNNGNGYYLDAEGKMYGFTLGAAVAKFDGLWIEDNFAVNGQRTGTLVQDHGTNPFPTSAGLGPDMTNNDETVVSFRIGYDWKDYIKGLRTAFKYSRGTGAHSSNLTNSADGKEYYREFDLRYDIPVVKNLGFRYVYMNYDSSIQNFTTSATIKGMPRQYWDQQRVYLDYVYQF